MEVTADKILSMVKNNTSMIPTGIKLICQRLDGEITTWHDVFDNPIEEIINKVKHQKNWIGGKFIEIYIEFTNNGKYYKVQVDLKNTPYNNLI